MNVIVRYLSTFGLTGLSQEAAVILGALIGVTGGLVRLRWRDRQRKSRLRQALWSEMKQMVAECQRHAGNLKNQRVSEEVTVPHDFIVRTAYDSNASDVGLLSREEVERVTEFYSVAEVVQRRISTLEKQSTTQRGTAKAFRREFLEMHTKMNAAIRTIEEHARKDLGRRPELQSIEHGDDDIEATMDHLLEVDSAD